MKGTTIGLLLGGVGAAGGVGYLVFSLGSRLSDTVAIHSYRIWGLAIGILVVGLLLGLLLDLLLRRRGPLRNQKPGVLDYQAGLGSVALVLLAGAVGSWFVPLRMARPLARDLAQQAVWRNLLQSDLAHRSYSFSEARLELARLAQVGEDFQQVFFGEPDRDSSRPGIVGLLQRYGMVPYAAHVEEQLQLLGWLPGPPQPCNWGYLAHTDEEERILTELKDQVQKKAGALLARAEAVKPRQIDWLNRWAKAYARQADTLEIVREYQRPGSIQKLHDQARLLYEATAALDRLTDAAWRTRSAEWQKQADTLRARSAEPWKQTQGIILSALQDVRTRAEAEDAACALNIIESKIPTYAQVAKQREGKDAEGKTVSWWQQEKDGLKAVFTTLRDALHSHPWQSQGSNERLVPALTALARLEAALNNALRTDTVAPDAGKPEPPAGSLNLPAGQLPWSVEEVLKLVSLRLQLDLWDVAEIEENGRTVQLVPAIRERWAQDFLVLKLVTPEKHTREQALEHAHRVAAHFLKLYAATLAKQWQAKINQVNEARKKLNEGRGDKYPEQIRKLVRALFTESWWASRRNELRTLIAPTGFVPQLIDVAIGDNAGRVNASVDENRRMAEEFVARLNDLADRNNPITPDLLARGAIWFTVFYAGDGTGKPIMNPFTQVNLIREGVPRNLTQARRPDGSIDLSKVTGPFEGGVQELSGAMFNSLLVSGPPPVVKPKKSNGTAGVVPGPGTADGER